MIDATLYESPDCPVLPLAYRWSGQDQCWLVFDACGWVWARAYDVADAHHQIDRLTAYINAKEAGEPIPFPSVRRYTNREQ